MSQATNLYNDIEVTTEVMTASKHRLIQMLFEKCLQQLKVAEMHLEKKQVLQKCNALTRAMDIVIHLHACLNMQDPQTKDVAKKFWDVYDLVECHILEANMNNSVANIRTAYSSIATLKEAWDRIA